MYIVFSCFGICAVSCSWRLCLRCFLLFFFFQAEDGIRDGHVTGVQTCALPIYRIVPPSQSEMVRDALADKGIPHAYLLFERSEERRVGKESSWQWSREN